MSPYELSMGFPATVKVYSIGALLLSVALLSVCDDAGSSIGGDVPRQVRGHVVEVVARGVTEAETLRIRDADGRAWGFTTEGFIGFTPAHLREHQLFGQTVLVSYVEKGDRLVAVDVTD